jgi:SAM-dependent methyltransferase
MLGKNRRMKLVTLKAILHPAALRRHAFGFCPVCNRRTVFLVTDSLETIRNHAICLWCKSCSRNRHLTLCVLSEFAARDVATLGDFRGHPEIAVLNTSSRSPIARALGNASNIFNTEFFDDVPSGSTKDGVRCENLENLSFADETLDLVISEDVLEHVRELEQGFAEIARVLRRGGCHVFTVPFDFDKKTSALFRRVGDVYEPIAMPIEYHGDFIRGKIPVFHRLGYDLFEILEPYGFETRLVRSEYHEAVRYGTFNCYTFISRKK